ncbi:MAG: hypothetical protein FWG64_04695 [Firmicutes bacterium]|nr:hypothetical protein [Bacillota bacterium]
MNTSKETMNQLTNDAEILLCYIYMDYLQKRKLKMPKSKAKYAGSPSEVQANFLPTWLLEDVEDTLLELYHKPTTRKIRAVGKIKISKFRNFQNSKI